MVSNFELIICSPGSQSQIHPMPAAISLWLLHQILIVLRSGGWPAETLALAASTAWPCRGKTFLSTPSPECRSEELTWCQLPHHPIPSLPNVEDVWAPRRGLDLQWLLFLSLQDRDRSKTSPGDWTWTWFGEKKHKVSFWPLTHNDLAQLLVRVLRDFKQRLSRQIDQAYDVWRPSSSQVQL